MSHLIAPTHVPLLRSQSFNTVNNLRTLGRWMRCVVIPNQSSVPHAYKEFEEDGTMKSSSYRDRVVDVAEEPTGDGEREAGEELRLKLGDRDGGADSSLVGGSRPRRFLSLRRLFLSRAMSSIMRWTAVVRRMHC